MAMEPNSNASRVVIRQWMRAMAHEYETATKLAEAAATELGLPDEWLDDETHWIWDLAINAMDERN